MRGQKIHYSWWIMLACCFIMACGLGIIYNCAGVFFKPVGDALGINRGPISLYMTLMNIIMTLLLPFAGRILTKYRIEFVVSIAFVVDFLVFGSLSLAKTVTYFYVAAVILGFCNAFILLLPVPILINNWFKKRVGFVMGVALACSGIGGVVFNTVGTMIIENYGWQAGYVGLALIGAALVLPFTLFVVRSKPSDLGLRPYGEEDGTCFADSLAENETGVAGAGGSSSMEWTRLNVRLFWGVLIFTSTLSLAGALQPHLPAYSTSIGFAASFASLALSLSMLGVILCKAGIGYLNDKIGAAGAMIVGISAGLLGTVFLYNARLSLLALFTGSFFYGIIASLAVVSTPLIVRIIFPLRHYNAIYSRVTMGTTFFSAIGVAFYGFLFDLNNSYRLSFVFIYVMTIIALIAGAQTIRAGQSQNSKQSVQL